MQYFTAYYLENQPLTK